MAVDAASGPNAVATAKAAIARVRRVTFIWEARSRGWTDIWDRSVKIRSWTTRVSLGIYL
jgi:hypothetical protein